MTGNELIIYAGISIFTIVILIEIFFLTVKFPKTAMLFMFIGFCLAFYYFGGKS